MSCWLTRLLINEYIQVRAKSGSKILIFSVHMIVVEYIGRKSDFRRPWCHVTVIRYILGQATALRLHPFSGILP